MAKGKKKKHFGSSIRGDFLKIGKRAHALKNL